MRTHKAFLEEIKDLLEENGAGHLFKAFKELFFKYIERNLDRAARMWPPRRGRQDVDTKQGRQDGVVSSCPARRGRQDVQSVVTRTWPPGHGHQDVDTRKGVLGHGRQDVVIRRWLPGHGRQDLVTRKGLPGRDHWPLGCGNQ